MIEARMNINIKNQTIGRIRVKVKYLLFYRVRKLKKRRPLINVLPIYARQWLTLDNFNSFPIPKGCLLFNLKSECFRFYIALLCLAARFGHPFNHSDRALAKEFGFHPSRIPAYKQELEDLGLIDVALIKPPGLKWPKTHYLIFSSWEGSVPSLEELKQSSISLPHIGNDAP